MKKAGILALLAMLALITVISCYLYAKRHPPPKQVFMQIPSMTELKAMCDARPQRTISRSEDMQQAIAQIVQVFHTALQNRIDHKGIAEVRLYASPQTRGIPGTYTPGGVIFGALQTFQINTDSTRSPLGETVRLPENLAFYTPTCVDFQEFDNEKKIMCLGIGKGFFADIVLYNLRSNTQISLPDRSVLLFDDKIYEAPDEDLLRLFSIWCPIPDWGTLATFPVRP
jgi:hypothetical protein